MLLRRMFLPLAALAALAVASPASAGTTTWLGSSGLPPDQITCPWTRIASTVPTLVNGVLTIATSTQTQNTYYQQIQSQLQMPSDSLVVEYEVKYVSGGTTSSSRSPVSLILETSAYRGTAVFIGNGEVWFNSGNASRGGTAACATADAFHLYRVVIVGTALRIYRDDVLLLTGSTFLDSGSGAMAGYPRILWGEASSLAYGTSQWRSFSHNAAPGSNCGVVAARPSTWGRLKLAYH